MRFAGQPRRYALLALSIEELEAGFATGEGLDTKALAQIDEQMQQIRSSLPPETIKVELEIMPGAGDFACCPQCGWTKPQEPIFVKDDETVADAFRRHRIEREATDANKASVEAAPVEAVKTPPEAKPAPVRTTSPPDRNPYVKQQDNAGSAVWISGVNKYPLDRTR